MVSEGTQNLSASDQRTIRSIKEVVRNYSDSDIYVALKEANNNADETVQKLLNQEPFHEVRRKRFKKIENTGHNGSVETKKRIEHTGPVVKSHPPDHSIGNARAAGYSRTDSRNGHEFWIVRDNRVNQNVERRKNPVTIPGGSTADARVSADVSDKSAMENNQKPYSVRNSGRPFTRVNYSRPRVPGDRKTNADRKEFFEERKSGFSDSASNTKNTRQNAQNPTSDAPTSDPVVSVTSTSDPVHVPSISSRAPATSAKWREVGAAGFRRQSSGNGVKQSSRPGSSNSNVIIGSTSAMESSRAVIHVLKKDHAGHETVSNSLRFSPSSGRGFLSNNHGRQYQPVGHQKGAPPNKEWKPKSKDKPNETNPGVIGTPIRSAVPSVDNSRSLELEATELQDQLSQVNISEDQNVIIAHHIRVLKNDCCRLTFGSFGSDSDTYGNFLSEPQVVRHAGESMELSGRDDVSAGNQATAFEEQVGGSDSTTPSEDPSDHVLPDINESSTAPTLENYDDLGLVHENSQVYENSQDMSAPEPRQLQDPPELPSFSQAYDLQTGYDIPYFRHSIDEAVRGHGLPSPQEVLTSHTANIPAASMTMMQQQPPMTQMYSQVHVPHFPNAMPYRQFISPMYVPPMGVPGYSSNPAYPHPSNGSSYVMMPGGSSQLNTNSLKYGMQQFKPVPSGSPTFGNYATPTGYAMNNPRMVGGVTSMEDSSRIKYKDGNMYLQNPQAETSELWIQTPRGLSGMQSAPYYNMQGQAAHPAYLQSHAGHGPYNAAAVAHTSHMQFPGMYHPQQPAAAMTNPAHLGAGLPSAAPGAQPGAFQQPQLGHLNWATNF